MRNQRTDTTRKLGRRTIVLLAIFGVVCVAGFVWKIRQPAAAADETAGTSLVPKVLCSSCGFLGEADQVKLAGEAARAPALGPGFKCPQCGKNTLYPNPYICRKCGKPFLMSKNASEELTSKCPQCGTDG